jgi:hypothetical protein
MAVKEVLAEAVALTRTVAAVVLIIKISSPWLIADLQRRGPRKSFGMTELARRGSRLHIEDAQK